MALLIRVDGSVVELRLPKRRPEKLAMLQELVGGYIELVPLRPGRYGDLKIVDSDLMFCDEDGYRHERAQNLVASVMSSQFPPHYVVGDVVLCRDGEID